MTRRIALAILATVWTTLLVGGAVAYFVPRAALLADLDDQIIACARSLDKVSDRPEYRELKAQPQDAIFRIGERWRNDNLRPNDLKPKVLDRQLIHRESGQYLRLLQLEFSPSAKDPNSLVIPYGLPADRVFEFLDRLRLALVGFGAIAGIASALIAVRVSKQALRPLHNTVQTIGEIDERRLDRRIDSAALPPELQPVADRLNQMLARLELAFAQRKQFLADASHELRTPVAALVTTIEVALRRPREAAEYARTLKVCLSDARLLRELIQTLLEHARSEAAPEAKEEFDAVALLNQCADVAEGLASARDVKVTRVLPPHLEITTYPNRLRGIVMNLLGNAVEHNRPGGTVDLHCESSGTDLVLTVSDTGPGISPEHIPHIFQPFYRASRQEQPEDARQHMGLGLFLVDSHVKALGAECRIESQVGAGTHFHIRLPGAVATARLQELEVTAV